MNIKVFVLAQKVGHYVAYHIVCPTKGLSPLLRMKRHSPDGNPYSVYGDACEQWTGVQKYSLQIVVMQATSSDIIDQHKEEEFKARPDEDFHL